MEVTAMFDLGDLDWFAGLYEFWGLGIVLCLLERSTRLLKGSVMMGFGDFCLLRTESVKCIMFPGTPVSPSRSLGT